MFNGLRGEKIKLVQINEPKGREPKIWSTDVEIEAFKEYLDEDGNYSLPTKAIEKEFLSEIKVIEESLNGGFEEVVEKIKSFDRVESDHKQGSEEWKEERSHFFTSTTPMYTKTGKLSDTYYDVMANRIAKRFKEDGDFDNYYEIMVSLNRTAVEAMQNGTDKERIARNKLSRMLGENVAENGMISIKDSLLGDSIDGSFTASKDIQINGKTIPKGYKVGVEIKNPRFDYYLNPNYMIENHWVQCQHHLFVGGFDIVITAKCFNDFDMVLDLVYPDEKFFGKLIEKYDNQAKELLDEVDSFVNKYSIGF